MQMATTSVSTLNEIYSVLLCLRATPYGPHVHRERYCCCRNPGHSPVIDHPVSKVLILSPSKKQYCLLHTASNAYRILRIRRKMIDLWQTLVSWADPDFTARHLFVAKRTTTFAPLFSLVTPHRLLENQSPTQPLIPRHPQPHSPL